MRLGGGGGQGGGVLGGARHLHPDDVAGALADEAGAVEDLADLDPQLVVGRAEHQRGRARDRLAGVGGPAEAGDRPRPHPFADVFGGELALRAISPLVSIRTALRELTRSAIAPTACGSYLEGIARQIRSSPASSIAEAGRTSIDSGSGTPGR